MPEYAKISVNMPDYARMCVIPKYTWVAFLYVRIVIPCLLERVVTYTLFYKQHFFKQCQVEIGKKLSKW